MSLTIVSADLGQAHDYTAIAISEVNPGTDDEKSRHDVRHLDRLKLGSPYTEQVDTIHALCKKLPGCRLVVDQTGVGRPVVDMLRAKGLRPIAITITGGDSVSRDARTLEYRVPKRQLVSMTQVLLQNRRLRVAKSLPHAETLTKEMLAFKVEISKAGHDTYGNDWRENPHDDLVLAVSMGAWFAEYAGTPQIFV